MKVLVYSAKGFEIPYLKKANKGRHYISFKTEPLTEKTVALARGFDIISIFSADKASSDILSSLKKLGVIGICLRSVGHDNVALIAAQRLCIKVANVPGYSPHAIAEHTVAMLLALNRHLIESNQRVSRFNFNTDHLVGFDLNNKTVGIVGTGKIGSVMAKIMHGFGCHLLGHDIEENKLLKTEFNMSYKSLEDLCSASDVITLHVPLTPQTTELINKSLISRMKKGVILLNTARGKVINTPDVLEGLESGIIGALGLDVYENERGVFFGDRSNKIPNDKVLQRLVRMPNVLITGHHAFLTKEALTNIAETTIYNISSWQNNQLSGNELY